MQLDGDETNFVNESTLESRFPEANKEVTMLSHVWSQIKGSHQAEYNWLLHLGIYLPPVKYTTRRWLGMITDGSAGHLEQKQISDVKVLRWRDVSIAALLQLIAQSEKAAEFAQILPPLTRRGGTVKLERQWLLNVIKVVDNTILQVAVTTAVKKIFAAKKATSSVTVCAKIATLARNVSSENVHFCPP